MKSPFAPMYIFPLTAQNPGTRFMKNHPLKNIFPITSVQKQNIVLPRWKTEK